MGKTLTSAYTDYPDGIVRHVTLLSYDNNKLAHVRFEDGREDHIKAGYLRADAGLTRPIAAIHWHMLGGGNRRAFKRRQRKTTYRLYVSDPLETQGYNFEERVFSSKAQALQVALRHARELQSDISVCASTVCRQSAYFNHREVLCRPDGLAYVVPGRANSAAKYLRGYGKVRSTLR